MSLIENDKPLTAITDKHRRVAALMVYGVDGRMAERHGLEPGKPLAPQTCADYLGVRRAYVRNLLADPLFRAEMTQMLAAKRLGYMPHALERVRELTDSDNEGVALRASETMLGERQGSGTTVNVHQTNVNATAIRPGYVVRLPPDLTPNTTPDP
jgi:hypothetical protein